MYTRTYLLIGSFKHSTTSVLFTDDPSDLASDDEREEHPESCSAEPGNVVDRDKDQEQSYEVHQAVR